MKLRLRALIDPFIIALLSTVVLASFLPPRAGWATIMDGMAEAGIVLLFFLHGAKLSRQAIWAGAGNWRLHLMVLGATYVLFPLLGLAIIQTPGVTPATASGLLFLTLLPSTVQSSIAFTAVARGNVAAAVCSASLSNLIGVFLTPLLVASLMHVAAGGAPAIGGAVRTIALQLLLPFLLGNLLRPLVGQFIERRKSIVTKIDRGSILLVVYTAFGAAVVGGLWQRVTAGELALISVLCLLLLLVVLTVTWSVGRLARLPREDGIVLLFCGSKKSLASGVPIAAALFAAQNVGIIIVPLMLFHQMQLIACAFIARTYAASSEIERTP